ncbi:MAG: MgtC/SapB family protein [Gemmatirosa sp.]
MNWRLVLEYLAQLAGAFALVAAASRAFVLLGRSFIGDAGEGHGEAHARIIEGLMTGVGFIGGGAILKSRQRVHGTATAAGIWMTGALGAAAGHGRWELAIVASLLTLGTLRWLTVVERRHIRRDYERGARPWDERDDEGMDARADDERAAEDRER